MKFRDGDRPTVLGCGLIALDLIVTSDGTVTHSIGGTCGNVLTLLAAHAVNIIPAGRIGDDVPGDLICAQLTASGGDLSLLQKTSDIRTPRIVELVPISGSIRHRFAFSCPRCMRRFPRNSTLREEKARRLTIDWSNVDLFFFDRPTPDGVHLAKLAKDAGVVVMFEPPKSQSRSRLYQCMKLADIVKYSSQNFKNGLPSEVTNDLQLLIETQDGNGLRYRQQGGAGLGDWQSLPAFDPVQPRDAAGAGDWCTAGFISHVVKQKGTWRWTRSELEAAMAYGQALAAISVCFIGPLGALFALSEEQLTYGAQKVLQDGSVPERIRLQREDKAFGPAWPPDIRPTQRVCDVCLV